MKYSSIVLAAVLVLFSGCADRAVSDSSASPTFAGKAECERSRGVWRASLGLCETSKGFEKVDRR